MIRGILKNDPQLLTRESWGPIFWNLFHRLAEYSGCFPDVVRNDDELYAWTNIMKYQKGVMPCALCSNHFDAYVKKNPLATIKKLRGTERKEFLRRWVYNIHSEVNARKQVANPVSYEMLEGMYKGQKVVDLVKSLETMMNYAVEKKQATYASVVQWKNNLAKLRGLYGI
jgi:hypothetical protein